MELLMFKLSFYKDYTLEAESDHFGTEINW
jgi:hypothetical protein